MDSENFGFQSINYNRELGLMISNRNYFSGAPEPDIGSIAGIKQIMTSFEANWADPQSIASTVQAATAPAQSPAGAFSKYPLACLAPQVRRALLGQAFNAHAASANIRAADFLSGRSAARAGRYFLAQRLLARLVEHFDRKERVIGLSPMEGCGKDGGFSRLPLAPRRPTARCGRRLLHVDRRKGPSNRGPRTATRS